jgi:hypothetical protein
VSLVAVRNAEIKTAPRGAVSCVDEAPGVEPGRRVVGAGDRVFVGAWIHDRNQVAFRGNRSDRRGQLGAIRGWLTAHDLREEGDHALKARLRIRVVLDVLVGQPVTGIGPVVALQQFAHDVQRGLLVGVLQWIGVGEQRFVGSAGDRLLRVQAAAAV